jgi:inosine/xanthosine triphosphatase
MTVSAVAGTFDVLHEGHKALIRRAFEVGDKVFIGMTSDRMAAAGRSVTVPMGIRRRELEDFVRGLGEAEIFEIDDIYGPDSVMDGVDVLVVSEETVENGRKVNERRISRGLPPLELSVVPLKMSDSGEKISSSSILRGRYGRSGTGGVMDIAVGSANMVKVAAVRSVMERVYGDVRVTPVDVDSGVPPQPFGEQTPRGARNRAEAALGGHDLSVGIEAGVFEMFDGLYDIQHCAIVDRDGGITYGTGPGFRYPDAVAGLVRAGSTVGDAMRQVYGSEGVGKRQGAIGLLSKGLMDRKTLTEQAVIAAMVPRIWDERDVPETEDRTEQEIPHRRIQDDRPRRQRPSAQHRAGAQGDPEGLQLEGNPGDGRRHEDRRVRGERAHGRGRPVLGAHDRRGGSRKGRKRVLSPRPPVHDLGRDGPHPQAQGLLRAIRRHGGRRGCVALRAWNVFLSG